MDYTQTNVLSMTGGSDFATIADLANYVDLTTAQTITSGIKTFTALPQSSAVPSTGSELVNKTYVDGAFVTLGTTQTITGAKTFNADVRLPTGVSLILGATATGGKILHTAPHNYYDNQAGNHYFFIAGLPNMYIDTDGVNIENGKFLYFNGKRCSLIDNGTQLVYDVPTGNSHSFRTANTQRMTISADANGTLLTFPAGTIMREYTSFNWFLYQLPAGHTLKYQVGGTDILEVSSAGAIVYEALSMRNGKTLTWNEGFTNIAYLRKDTTTSTFDYEVATGYTHKFMVNGVSKLLLDATDATFSGNISMPTNNCAVAMGTTNQFILQHDNTGLAGQYRIPSGWVHNFQVGGVGIAQIRSEGFYSFQNNTALALGASSQIEIKHDTATSQIQYKSVGTYSHNFLINSVSAVIIDASGVIIQSTAVGAGVPDKILYLSQNKANYIGSSTTDMRYNCATGGSHNFYQNTSTYLGFWNSTSLTLSPNNISLQLGTTAVAQIKHDTATSQLQYRTLSSYFHDFYINGTQHFEMNTSGVITNIGGYRAKNGVSGALDPVYIVISWDGSRSHIWINNTDLGGTAIASDYRLKENIKPARPVLDKLCSIPMREFEYKNIGIWKKGKGINYGIIAHELQDAFPEYENLVSCDKDKLTCDGDIQPQSLTSAMNLLFMGSIQELNAKCIAQQTQMEAMQKQIDGLVLALSKIVSA